MKAVEPVWTGERFAGLHAELIGLLRGLSREDWDRTTSAGEWKVRDVAAHILDVSGRRLSSLRDGYRPPAPPIAGYDALLQHIDRLNAEWIAAARRLSPQTILDLLAVAGSKLAAVIPSVDPDAAATAAVAWAGERESRAWLDIGREYTELWHHQDQIREAVGARPLRGAHWLRPVLDISVRALPHAYRAVPADAGESVAIVAEGEGGGEWTLLREAERWTLLSGAEPMSTCRIRVDALAMARLLLHRLEPDDARAQLRVEGRTRLAEPFARARAVMVRAPE